ncbi:MAG: hydrogenase [Candidatus Pacebacteria bacterium]|nr:hydrogenase [Candidatus Paceibacterota bacterium]
MSKKLKIGIISLTSCEGCQIAILSLGEKLLKLKDKVEFLEFRYLEDQPWPEHFDVAFIEGSPITKEQLKTLKEARKRADKLIVLGNCAALGGVHEIKNYKDKEKIQRYVYKHKKGIANPEIKEIDNFVKVDFTIPGCPINPEEFLMVLKQLIKGEEPKIRQIFVCGECPLQGTKNCFLLQKKVCFGPWTLGGCGAPCPKNGLLCLACRGFKKNVNLDVMIKSLSRFVPEKELKEKLEIFGLRDELFRYENNLRTKIN